MQYNRWEISKRDDWWGKEEKKRNLLWLKSMNEPVAITSLVPGVWLLRAIPMDTTIAGPNAVDPFQHKNIQSSYERKNENVWKNEMNVF